MTAVPDKGLRGNSLGLFSSVVIGLASTAPAYSLSSTLGLVVALVAASSPIALAVAAVPALCIAIAYRELNRREPDCGTSFRWAQRSFGATTGWLTGWVMISADIIVVASLAQVAGQSALRLAVPPAVAQSPVWTTVAGVG